MERLPVAKACHYKIPWPLVLIGAVLKIQVRVSPQLAAEGFIQILCVGMTSIIRSNASF